MGVAVLHRLAELNLNATEEQIAMLANLIKQQPKGTVIDDSMLRLFWSQLLDLV